MPRRRRSSRRCPPRFAQPSLAVRGGAQQVLPHEAVEIAVQDPLRVADLVSGPVVLYPGRRVKRIAADLRTPLRRLLLAPLRCQLLRLLSLLLLEQARAQYLHRGGLVLGLRALVLRLGDD